MECTNIRGWTAVFPGSELLRASLGPCTVSLHPKLCKSRRRFQVPFLQMDFNGDKDWPADYRPSLSGTGTYRWSQIPRRTFQYAELRKPLLGVPLRQNTRTRYSCQGLSCTAPFRPHDKPGRRKSGIHQNRFQLGSQSRTGKALPA